jgi:voltage-gated potassium channel
MIEGHWCSICAVPRRAESRRRRRATGLYVWAIAREFRISALVLIGLVLLGAALHVITPLRSLDGARPSVGGALYAAWMALLNQPSVGLSEAWYLLVIDALYPLLGIVLVGEGLIRFGLLMLSRRRGEKEWMKVMAATHRNHVVLCGLGHLGFRILQELLASGVEVVAIERDAACRFLAQAKATRTPVLERDMREDQALVDAGVERARVIVIASNDDLANLEVALDARRLNPAIRIVMRMFDQQIASKIQSAFTLDQAFSASALAAPAVTAMVLETNVLASFKLAGVVHLISETAVAAGSVEIGATLADLEGRYGVRVLQLRRAGETVALAEAQLAPGDRVVTSGDTTAQEQLARVLQAGREG